MLATMVAGVQLWGVGWKLMFPELGFCCPFGADAAKKFVTDAQ